MQRDKMKICFAAIVQRDVGACNSYRYCVQYNLCISSLNYKLIHVKFKRITEIGKLRQISVTVRNVKIQGTPFGDSHAATCG